MGKLLMLFMIWTAFKSPNSIFVFVRATVCCEWRRGH